VEACFRFLETHIDAEAEADLRRLEAIREATGPNIGLMIDINTAFDRDTALAHGLTFAAFEPLW
jgi:L-alanine-DL-glutamate epimerase-like enolase superfamily enzyme